MPAPNAIIRPMKRWLGRASEGDDGADHER